MLEIGMKEVYLYQFDLKYFFKIQTTLLIYPRVYLYQLLHYSNFDTLIKIRKYHIKKIK